MFMRMFEAFLRALGRPLVSFLSSLGDFALFLQTPLGMVIFVGVPLFGFVIYDVIRRQKLAKKENEKTAELEAEIERLKKLAKKEDESEE